MTSISAALPRLISPGRLHRDAWLLCLLVMVAAAIGVAAGGGNWEIAVLLTGVPIYAIAALAQPERVVLILLVVLPFLIYPAGVGGLSLFLGVPLFGFVALVLLLRRPGSLSTVRRLLPVGAFAVLLVLAAVATADSEQQAVGLSRLIYLGLLGYVAWALAATLSSGRLKREAVVGAAVLGASIASIALFAQFLAQFGAGEAAVLDWLRSVYASFAGERAAATSGRNLVVPQLDVQRGVFPFMSPPSAGLYLMMALIAVIWLRRERRNHGAAESTLLLFALAIIATALIVTFSRQAWIGAAVGVLVLSMRRPIWLLGSAVWIFLLASFVPAPGGGTIGDHLISAGDASTTSTATRLDLWRQAVEQIPKDPLLGVGPGQVASLNPNPENPTYYAHNLFLDAALELGLLGAAALIAVFVLAIRAAFRNRATLALGLLSAFVVASLFDDVLYFPRNTLLLAVAFALIAGDRYPGVGGAGGGRTEEVPRPQVARPSSRRYLARA